MATAEKGVVRAQAEWEYASKNLKRLEPLLAKQFVTADNIDKAKTTEIAQQEALRQAQSQLTLAQARFKSAQAQHEQAVNAVTTLEPLINQRGAKAAAVKKARYDLDNCKVYAPFEARVTNLTISEGAYAHVGQQMFVLIDARRWWAIANFEKANSTTSAGNVDNCELVHRVFWHTRHVGLHGCCRFRKPHRNRPSYPG